VNKAITRDLVLQICKTLCKLCGQARKSDFLEEHHSCSPTITSLTPTHLFVVDRVRGVCFGDVHCKHSAFPRQPHVLFPQAGADKLK